MKLGLRLFLGFFLIVGLSAWLLLKLVIDEIKPVVRQVSEDNLVEISQLLAAVVAPTFAQTQQVPTELTQAYAQLAQQRLQIPIWRQHKQQLDLRVYVTDAEGIVRFDSSGRDVGKNYSRWNDVYLTLRGQYGARTTRDDANDEFSSTMYVAAPLRDRDRIIGVLTVVVPNRSHQPYLLAAQQQLKRYGSVMVVLSLLIGVLTTWWLIRALRHISEYADRISHEPGLKAPQFSQGTELEKLMQSLQTMREALDGKSYVEEYVHALTHELKSPLAATRAAQEILQEASLSPEDRQRFLVSIQTQVERMQLLIDKLLLLAKLEQQREIAERSRVDIQALVQQQQDAMLPRLEQKNLRIDLVIGAAPFINADRFWLNLAINNLFENAVNFAVTGSTIHITWQRRDEHDVELSFSNEGEPIPDYALTRLGERFYALTRQDGQRGSGLGLRLVREVARLHGGSAHIANHPSGVKASIRLPC